MKSEREVKRICDKCSHYTISACGCTETCWAKFQGSKLIISMDDNYIEQRMSAEKQHCKSFKKL